MPTDQAHPAADLFPLMGEAELIELADDIRTKGLNQPIWLYDDPERGRVILDGRNRLAACEIAGVKPRTQRYTGTDPIGFSVSQNLKHRHLTPGQKAMVALALEPLYAEEATKRKEQAGREHGRGQEKVVADLPQPKPAPKARDKAAKVTKASGRAVGQAKRVKEKAPDLAVKVAAGEIALDRAERIIRDREAIERRVAEAKAQAAAAPIAPSIDIRHGDFRDALADLTDLDAIITDPPYPGEFLPLLADLSVWADRVLKPDGVLAVLFGQTYLPDVYRLLEGGRPYRWTAAYLTPGPGYASKARRVQSNWKPLLIYGGGPRFGDIIRSEGSDADAKSHHKWGQDYGAFHTIVERLTKPGDTIADPFMGAGTTLLAAHALGRHAVGCDIDPEHVETARGRLS